MSKQHTLAKMSDRDRRNFNGNHYKTEAKELFDLCRSPALSIDAIEKALAFDPLAFAMRDMNNMLPLHVVCGAFKSGGGSVDVVKYLLELYPESVEEGNQRGYLPLHVACWGGAPLQVVQYLYERTPKLVRDQERYGGEERRTPWLWTPLHHACRGGGSPLEVIQYLVEKCHESVTHSPLANPDSFPLHLACEKGAPNGVINCLVTQWPVVVKVCDNTGCLPLLHKACYYVKQTLQLEDIQCLVEQWPESLKHRDLLNGATPLHYACGKKTAPGVIQYMLEKWPGAVLVTDWDGRLPLHNACMGRKSYNTYENDMAGTPLEDIQLLVEQWPASVEVRTKIWRFARGGDTMSALSYAAQRSPPDDTLVNWLELPWRRGRKRSKKRSNETEPEEGEEGVALGYTGTQYDAVEYIEEFA
jgi:ankyrin repeat protein